MQALVVHFSKFLVELFKLLRLVICRNIRQIIVLGVKYSILRCICAAEVLYLASPWFFGTVKSSAVSSVFGSLQTSFYKVNAL